MSVHQSDIDAGREPARTMRQIASAIRQDSAGAGARLWTLKLILNGESTFGPVDLPPETKDAIDVAISGMAAHLERLEGKLKLAIAAELLLDEEL